MFNQLKRVSAFALVAVFCLGLFSFKSINSNETNLGGAKKATTLNYGSTENAKAARVVSAAKAVWKASGKEVAKFVAYEVVLAGIEWIVGSSEEIGVASQQNVDAEAAYKLSKL